MSLEQGYRVWGFCPEGAEQISPGQRPETGKSNRPQALKGRDTGPPMFRPFRAQESTCDPIPGRCPGLICGCPFGATDKDAGIDATVSSVFSIQFSIFGFQFSVFSFQSLVDPAYSTV